MCKRKPSLQIARYDIFLYKILFFKENEGLDFVNVLVYSGNIMLVHVSTYINDQYKDRSIL